MCVVVCTLVVVYVVGSRVAAQSRFRSLQSCYFGLKRLLLRACSKSAYLMLSVSAGSSSTVTQMAEVGVSNSVFLAPK